MVEVQKNDIPGSACPRSGWPVGDALPLAGSTSLLTALCGNKDIIVKNTIPRRTRRGRGLRRPPPGPMVTVFKNSPIEQDKIELQNIQIAHFRRTSK